MITTIYTRSGTVFEHQGPIKVIDTRDGLYGYKAGAKILECSAKITEAYLLGRTGNTHFFITENKDYCKVSVIAVSSIDAIVVEE